jgi:hypothetical protein
LLPNCFFNVNIFYIFVRETIKTLQDEKYIVIGALLITGMIFAQNTNVTPKLEVVGNLVRLLFFMTMVK